MSYNMTIAIKIDKLSGFGKKHEAFRSFFDIILSDFIGLVGSQTNKLIVFGKQQQKRFYILKIVTYYY